MKATQSVSILLPFLLFSSAYSGPEVDRLLDGYSKIEAVSCHIRRTKTGNLGKMTFLSRVYWTNNDQLHAEGISPIKRRTIADGKTLWQHIEGDSKGFSRPVDELSEPMTISLRMVPGTAMDHLLRLKGFDETPLAADDAAAKQVGIQAGEQYVVLRFDAADRLIGLRFFKTSGMKELAARYDYSGFAEAAPGAWVPLAHELVVFGGDGSFSETVKVDRFVANQPLAESLFISSSFFDKSVDFVSDFANIPNK
jgi:hypothetical protein